MKVKQEIFADAIGKINFNSGMVRFDYVTIQPTGDAQEKSVKSSVQIVMPLQGFFNALNSSQQLIDKLLEAGVLTASAPAAAEKPAKKTAAKRGRKKKE